MSRKEKKVYYYAGTADLSNYILHPNPQIWGLAILKEHFAKHMFL